MPMYLNEETKSYLEIGYQSYDADYINEKYSFGWIKATNCSKYNNFNLNEKT